MVPLFAASCLLFAQKGAAPGAAAEWNLVFADEFNGTEIDLMKWVPHEPAARAQTYAPQAVAVNGGQLHIVARALTPGTVTTFGTFAQTYGRFEIRCKVPAGRGLRSRFRLLPVPYGPLPEIGVFETDSGAPSKCPSQIGGGRNRRSVHSAIHSPRRTCRRRSMSSPSSGIGTRSHGSPMGKSDSNRRMACRGNRCFWRWSWAGAMARWMSTTFGCIGG